MLEGLGGSQGDVSRFVLRLEQLDLFRSVKLLDTSREAFADRHVVAFRLECVIDPMLEDEEERS